MTDTTIFTPDQGAVVETPVVNTTAPSLALSTEVQELVGVGKKYQTVEAALAAVPHAQKHINTLEVELAELRAKVAAQKTTQELLDELKSGIPQGETLPNPGLSQDVLLKAVEQVVTQKENQKTAAVNQSTVVNTFKEAYGDQAESFYNKVAAEAGLSVSMLNELAKTSPLAVIKLAGIAKKDPLPGKIRSDVNTTGFQNGTPELSAKVAKGNSTRDVLNAWHIAGEKVKQKLGN